MRQATIRLKFVTPAYLGGANPRSGEPELRIPSIRGLLRYWLRAAAGAANPDVQHVRTCETDTFGSVSRGSPLSIWLSNAFIPASPATRVSVSNFVSAMNFVGEPPSDEQHYLFWSMKQKATWRKAFPAGTEFDLHLALRARTQDADTGKDADIAFQRALGALWLLVHLGGVGSRSRRGAGSLSPLNVSVTGFSSDPVYLPFAPPSSVEDLQKHLQDGIAGVRARFSTNSLPYPRPATQLPPFDILARDYCRLWILRSPTSAWNTPDDVLDELGASLREYRGSVHPLEARAAFGLPIIVRDGGNIPGRRASPLLLRVSSVVTVTGQPEYIAVAVLFKSQFQPTSARSNDGPPDYGHIERWITSDQYLSALEVQL